MEHDLAFLHTASVHVETFSELAAAVHPGLRVHHAVAEHLLEEARQQGLTEGLALRVNKTMANAASSGARVVVCTCSTIGALAEQAGGAFRAMRIDRPMADQAVKRGRRILVVAALESTLGPTLDLLRDSARAAGVQPQMTQSLARDAWAHFERGDHESYIDAVAEVIRAGAFGADVVVLAQASMAPAAGRCADLDVPIFSSPAMGVAAAIEAVLARA